MRVRSAVSILLALPVVISAGLSAGDWSQFRGPNGSGVFETNHLPVVFGPDRGVVWRTSLPPGHSSPVLTSDRIFLTAHEDQKLFTFCLDRATGRILWRRETPRPRQEAFHEMHGPASPSPATDGRNVYVFFGDFGMLSYGPDGEERWRVELGPFNLPNGHGTSPVLVDDLVILLRDQDDMSYLLAVSQNDGRLRWKVERPEAVHGYATPSIYRPASGPPQIIVPGSYQVTAYSADRGEKLWWVRGLTWQVKPSAAVDEEMIYVTGWAPGADSGERQVLPAFEDAVRQGDSNGDRKISEEEAIQHGWRHQGGWALVDLDDDTRLDGREWEFFRARRAAHNVTMAIRPGQGRGDLTATSVRWTYEKAVPVVSTPLSYRGAVYTIKDGGILTAFESATGKVLRQERIAGAIDRYFASPVAGDGKIFLASETGKITVLKPGAPWEVLAVNDLAEACYATPAIGEQTLYVRTVQALYAFREAD
jgi:outer membrane protein assembly factor BamB